MIPNLNKVYGGWLVLTGSFICKMMVIGCTTYIFGIFVVPVTEEFGISRTKVNNGLIMMMLGTAIWSPVVGKAIDTYSSRIVIALAGGLFGASLVTISVSQSLSIISFIILVPLSLGVAGSGAVATNAVAVRWFKSHRGRALGFLAISASAGGAIVAPIAGVLVETFQWRLALASLGISVGCLIPLVALFLIKNNPSGREVGFSREFKIEEGSSNAEGAEDGVTWTFRALLREKKFWLLTLGIGLLLASDQSLLASKVPYFHDAGIDLVTASLIVSCMTLSAVVGKLVVGFMADRTGLKPLFYVVAVCHVGLLAVYCLQPGITVFFIAASLFGIAVGGVYPVWTTMTASVFGSRSYGTAMGTMFTIQMSMSIATLLFVGAAYDATASYLTPFMVLICGVLASILFIARIKELDR